MAKLFFQGPLKVHLFSSLEGAHDFTKPCSAAGATSPSKKQTKVKHTLLCNRSQLSLVSPEKEKQRGWDRAEGEGCLPMHRDQNAGCSREYWRILSGEYICIEKKAGREKHQVGLDMCESGFGRSQLIQGIQQHVDRGNSGQAHPRYRWRTTIRTVMHADAAPN